MVTIDVLPGLLIGVISMVLLVIYHATRPHVSVLGRVPGVADAYGDVDRHPDYLAVPGLLMLRLEAPLFYANATLVTGRIKRFAGAEEPPPRAVILDIGANGRLDITSCEKLSELVTELRSAGIDFALAEVRAPAVEHARRAGLLGDLGEDRVFHTIDEAVDALAVGG